MDLLEILRSRVDALQEGEYIRGLKAVLQHIEVAGRHLERGQRDANETAFTDAIYRTNQAFEGSLKEAFRVLAGRDPASETPHNIENYLQEQNVLRQRVVAQLTNYRREWRNPSTHDYRLDFDEDEALLAIVTVSAFAIVLVDQITERIAFDQAKMTAAEQPSPSPPWEPVLEQVASLIEQFVMQFNQTHSGKTDVREVEISGALAGFLSTAAPEINAQIDAKLASTDRPDFLITTQDEQVIIEIKRGRGPSKRLSQDAIQQTLAYMEFSGIHQAIVFIYNVPNKGELSRDVVKKVTTDDRLIVISVT